jgi:hypothetical protein
MDHTSRIALLIDADNVSVDVLRQVLHRLIASGDRLQHRRAYGSVQKAVEFGEVCRDHAIRFLPSTFAGPNATDIAMAIDAVELVLRQPVDEVVIVSSDMDYSPLIVRLRELGCRVTGYGQQGKSGRDIERDYERVYDQFSVIGPGKPRAVSRPLQLVEPRGDAAEAAAVAPATKPSNVTEAKRAVTALLAKKVASAPPAQEVVTGAPKAPGVVATAAPKAKAAPTPKVKVVPVPKVKAAATPKANAASVSKLKNAPVPKAKAAPEPRPKAVPVPTVKATPAAKVAFPPITVERVLGACPGLRGGAAVRLNGVAKALRDAGLLSQSGRTTALFKRLASHFELLPADKPESVRFRGG